MKIDKRILMILAEMGLFFAGVALGQGMFIVAGTLVWTWVAIRLGLTQKKNEYEK